jgi:hypothetical protein
VTIVSVLSDLLTPDRSWWTSVSVIGSLFTGQKNFNTVSPDMGTLLLGLVLSLVVYAIIGLGLPSYLPIFRRFNIHPILGGALYGLLIWLAVDVLFLNGLTSGRLSMLWLLPADLLGGAAMGWWLSRVPKAGVAPRTDKDDLAHDIGESQHSTVEVPQTQETQTSTGETNI